MDVTSGVELALEASLFTMTSTGVVHTLTMNSIDLTDAGIYVLRLLVRYPNYAATAVYHDFEVEFIDPCLSAVLTIDDSILMSPPLITY